MSEGTLAAALDFALKAGVPSALGCVIVWYLLWKLVPRLIDTFERTLAAQAASFERALDQHRETSTDLRKTLVAEGELNRKHREDEGRQTRDALDKLHSKTHELAQLTAASVGVVTTDEQPMPRARRTTTAVGG